MMAPEGGGWRRTEMGNMAGAMRRKSTTFAERLRLKRLASSAREAREAEADRKIAEKKAPAVARKEVKFIKDSLEVASESGKTRIWDGLYRWDIRDPLAKAVGEWLINYFEKQGFDSRSRSFPFQEEEVDSPCGWSGRTLALDWDTEGDEEDGELEDLEDYH